MGLRTWCLNSFHLKTSSSKNPPKTDSCRNRVPVLYVPSHFSCVWLFNTMDHNPRGSSVHGTRQEYSSELPYPPPEDLPDPVMELVSLMSAAWTGWFFTVSATWEAFSCFMKEKVKVLVPLLCLTLCDPMNCSPPGFSVCGDSPGKNIGMGCHSLLQGIL